LQNIFFARVTPEEKIKLAEYLDKLRELEK